MSGGEGGKQSPWRNPMVWLMLALPASAVVAGISTVVIAVRAGGSDAIPDSVRRTAQIQTVELGPDERAAARKLSMVLSAGDGTVSLLPVTGEIDRKAALTLALRHPTRAAEDIVLTLAPTEAGWEAKHTLDVAHDWNVQASDADGTWRVLARLPAGQRGVLLRPAFGGDEAKAASPAAVEATPDAGAAPTP